MRRGNGDRRPLTISNLHAPTPRRREGSAAIAELLKVFLKARADEIGVAARLIAPFVGVSLYTWSAVIGIVLAVLQAVRLHATNPLLAEFFIIEAASAPAVGLVLTM